MRKVPKQTRSRVLVDAVMQAVEDLLDTSESLSIARLASRAGVGVTSIYVYFGRKDAVLGTMLDRLTESNFVRLREKLRSLDDAPLDRTVDTMAGAIADMYFGRPAFLGKVVDLIVARSQQRKQLAFRDRFADLLADRVCRDLRYIRTPEARAAMRGLCDAVMGIIFAELVRGKPDVSTVRITMRRIGRGEVATLIALNDARARTLDADGGG